MTNNIDAFHRVVLILLDKHLIQPTKEEIYLYPYVESGIEDIEAEDLHKIFSKLKDDFGVADDVNFTDSYDFNEPEEYGIDYTDHNQNWISIRVNEKFKEWAVNLLNKQKMDSEFKPKINLEITFTDRREIVLNGIFLLSKPNIESENELVFSYLYAHQNKICTRDEIEKEIKHNIAKSFHKIIENLGFTPELKNCFFDISKESIRFKNPISDEQIKAAGLKYIRMS